MPSSLASRLTFTFNSFVLSFLPFLASQSTAALAEDSAMSGNTFDDFLLKECGFGLIHFTLNLMSGWLKNENISQSGAALQERKVPCL